MKENLESTFEKLSDAFTDPAPSPRPAAANKAVANAYARGVEQYQATTGRKIALPDYCKGIENFPPAKMMIESQDE